MNKLILRYDINGNLFRGEIRFLPILELLNSMNFPPPNFLEWTTKKMNWKSTSINSFVDSIVILSLDPKERHKEFYSIHIDNASEQNISISFDQNEKSSIICIRIPQSILDTWSKIDIYTLFIKLLELITDCSVANCYFEKEMRKIIFTHFDYNHRTFYSPMLFWLQYFGKEELERQGGMEALESNPLLKTERIHDGLLIEVGESPYDAFTPEGEELLVRATRSLPPVRNI
jgi:hypothetical protein